MTGMCGAQVAGAVFLDEDAATYTPPPELASFLAPMHAAPIYIGFGSLVPSVCVCQLYPICQIGTVSSQFFLLE